MKKKNRNAAIRQMKKRAKRKQSTHTASTSPSLNGFSFEVLTRDDVSKEHKNIFRQMLSETLVSIKNSSAADDIEKAKELIEEAYKTEPKPISCGSSCSGCCHQKVDVLALEEEGIWNLTRENGIEFDENRLQKQLSCQQWSELNYEDRACVFLDDKDNCRIYDIRPLVCRRYYVTSEPQLCASGDRSLVDYSANFPADTFLSGLMSKYSSRSIASFVREKLDEDQ